MAPRQTSANSSGNWPPVKKSSLQRNNVMLHSCGGNRLRSYLTDRPTGAVSAVPLNSDRSTKVPVSNLRATGTSCSVWGLSPTLNPKRHVASRQSWFRETWKFFQGVGQRDVRPRAVHYEAFFASTTATTRVPVQQLPVFRRSCILWIAISCRIPTAAPKPPTTHNKQCPATRLISPPDR
jgi:hypothetical protein